MSGSRRSAIAGVALWLLTSVFPALGQQPPAPPTPAPPPGAPGPAAPEPGRPVEGPPERPKLTPEEPLPTPVPRVIAPPGFLGPDIFNPPAHRGWITLTPSISVVGEYNDNLLLGSGSDKVEDYLLAVTPGFTISMQRPEYRLLGGYNFTAEFYAKETDLNDVAKRQQGFLDMFYELSPRVALTFRDQFIYDRESNVVTRSGISAGQQEAWRNTLSSRLQWQATQLTVLSLTALYEVLRFPDSSDDDASDSNTYQLGVGAEHRFTPRLIGIATVDAQYLDVQDDPTVTAFTPRVGLDYQITRGLRGTISGGPSFYVQDGVTRITPAGAAGFEQVFRSGAFRVGYERALSAESVGVVDRQSLFATLRLTVLRGLDFEVTPRFTRSDEDVTDDGNRKIDVLSVNVQASYQIARNISLIASYVFYQQTEDSQSDITQNRVFLGLQYAYPINFD